MHSLKTPWRDVQLEAPQAYCKRCGGEIYGDSADFCTDCEEEFQSLDTIIQYFKAWPDRLFAFLGSEKDEEYMKPVFEAMREYCYGGDKNGPDLYTWARS